MGKILNFSLTIGEHDSWQALEEKCRKDREMHLKCMGKGYFVVNEHGWGHPLTQMALSMLNPSALWDPYQEKIPDYPARKTVKLRVVHSSEFIRHGTAGYDNVLEDNAEALGLKVCSLEVPFAIRSLDEEHTVLPYVPLDDTGCIYVATPPIIDTGGSPQLFHFRRVIIGRDWEYWLHSDVANFTRDKYWIFEEK